MITRELIGKINANGRLFIERKGEMKPQECNYRERTCGDFCPHFGEPRSTDNSKDPEDDAKTELFICGGSVLIFDKLDDQRVAPTIGKPSPTVALWDMEQLKRASIESPLGQLLVGKIKGA